MRRTGNFYAKAPFACAILLLLIACNRQNQVNENESSKLPTAADILFGYSNEAGNQILVKGDDTLAEAETFINTINSSGGISRTKFIGRKTASKLDNGRESFYNFEAAGGYLFEVETGKVDMEKSAVLFTHNFSSGAQQMKEQAIEKSELPQTLRQRIEADKSRKIKRHECLAKLDDKCMVYLLEFEVKNDTGLGSLVLVHQDKIIYHDYWAKYDSTSTWRVDDGGEFAIGSLSILAAFERGGNIELITDWVAEEGFDVEYLREENGILKVIKEGSRYTAAL